MSKQDKATTERNAKTLRELVKRPENKVCADCKRNDPRWASWNIGVFVCIRCSGIHRSMGTHISKVKSVDLDMWTPEQMKNIQMWGNERANRYWEAHLKPGHIPPEHKVESFIRSKYESRRWAMDGPPPADPSVLDGDAAEAPGDAPAPAPASAPGLIPATPAPPVLSAPPTKTATSTRQAQRVLLSANIFPPPATSKPAKPDRPAATSPPPSAQNDLFSLDFTPPTTAQAASAAATNAPKQTAKTDILSLYSSASASTPAVAINAVGAAGPANTFMGNSGTGLWGVSSGWAAPAPPASADPWAPLASNAKSSVAPMTSIASPPAFGVVAQQPFAVAQSANVWGAPVPPNAQQNASTFDATSVWGNAAGGATKPTTSTATPVFDLFATTGSGANGNAGAPNAPKKDDAFGDLWGGFK